MVWFLGKLRDNIGILSNVIDVVVFLLKQKRQMEHITVTEF